MPSDIVRSKPRVIHPEVVSQARRSLREDNYYSHLAESFSALADSNRAKIIYTLMGREMCVSDIAAVVGISESAVSQHLRILRNLRWVKNHKHGRIVYYSLDDQHVRGLLELSLEHLRGS